MTDIVDPAAAKRQWSAQEVRSLTPHQEKRIREIAREEAILAMREPHHAFGLYVAAGDALKGQSLESSQDRAFAVEKAWKAMLTALSLTAA